MHDLVTVEDLSTTDPGMGLDLVCVHVPAEERPLGQPLGLTRGGVQCLRVRTGAHAFAIGVNTRVLGPRLLVTFHGARNDDAAGASMFKRLTWADAMQSAVLAISDPWTEPKWRTSAPRATMYVGQLDDAPDAEINALIDQVARELGVPLEGVTLMGVSAGATAAMRVAASRPVGRVILSNPFLDLDGVRRYSDAWWFEHGRTPAEYAERRAASPWRFDALAAWERGLQAGHDLRALYIQSVNDRRTAKRQLLNACLRLHLNPERGGPSADGRVLLVLHESTRHGVAPIHELRPLVDALFATPLEQVATAPLPLLLPGTWNIPPDLVEPDEERHSASRAQRRASRSPSPGAADDLALAPLAPPCHEGILLLSSSPGCSLNHVTWALGELSRVEARDASELRRQVRWGEPMGQDLPSPPQGQWHVYGLPTLFAKSPDTLADLPQARVLYQLRNPLDAVLAMVRRDRQTPQAADAEPPSPVRVMAAIERWNRSTSGLLQALHSHGERILVLRQPDTAAAWEMVLTWLGRLPENGHLVARLVAPAADARRLPPWLDEGMRSHILEHADLATYQRLLRLRGGGSADPAQPLAEPPDPL